MFFDDDPFSPPPANLNCTQDLNTGCAHLDTHAQLMSDPAKQMSSPVIFCIDGANAGQFVDLPLTAVKITLGVFDRKACDKQHSWRTSGCTPSHSKHTARGKRSFSESNHMDSVLGAKSPDENAGNSQTNNVPKRKIHTQCLKKILKVTLKFKKQDLFGIFCTNKNCTKTSNLCHLHPS